MSLIEANRWHKWHLGRDSFGHEITQGHTLCMNIDDAIHIPWARLSFEARFGFILFFSGVFGPEELDRKAVIRELAKIWDSEQLSLAFLNDRERFWELYRKYQDKYSEGVWRLDGYGISREEAERAGFIKPRRQTAIEHLCPPSPASISPARKRTVIG